MCIAQDVRKVLVGVLSGLETLHQTKLVHGAVHPGNVLIDASGRGVLAEYDFTKIPVSVSRNQLVVALLYSHL